VKFAFKIFRTVNGTPELLLEPAPINLPSVEAARALVEQFVSDFPFPVSITGEAENGFVGSWQDGEWTSTIIARNPVRSRC